MEKIVTIKMENGNSIIVPVENISFLKESNEDNYIYIIIKGYEHPVRTTYSLEDLFKILGWTIE